MIHLPKPVLHIRIPHILTEKEEDEVRAQLKDTANDYVVILTSDSPSGMTEMQVLWVLPKELSEEKADEIIELLRTLVK